MKRFIDLRGQVFADTDLPLHMQHPTFAFFDTRCDSFESFDGCQTFSSWSEFEDYFSTSDQTKHEQIERYKGLCPAWVFEKGEAA